MTSFKKRVAVGTRNSLLSLAQTEEILRPLRAHFPGVEIIVVPKTTGGDRDKSTPLLTLGRGIFVKDIELALLSGEIDFAVHSAKDLPAAVPAGLVLAAFGERQDPRDVLVTRLGLPLSRLPPGTRLGTSSPRRQALVKALRPDIETIPIRGNVDTRLSKARGDDYDGVVLAAAGIARLGRQQEITEYFSPESFTPDVGQGALAVEARASDSQILEMLAKVNHWPTSAAVRAERAFLKAVGGGCKVPVAAYARLEGAELRISAMAAAPDGSRLFRADAAGDAHDPEGVGRSVAQALMKSGAREIIGKGAGV